MSAAGFANSPLEDMVAVGRVDPHGARLWMRIGRPGPVRIEWWPEDDPAAARGFTLDARPDERADNTLTVDLPPEGGPLEPGRKHRFRVARAGGGDVLGEGRFETPPRSPDAMPERVAFAVGSCHQPFDARGRVHPHAPRMLEAVRRCVERHDAKIFFAIGDQMYSDFPVALSLFDPDYFARCAPPGRASLLECSAEEVRRLYHDRYRHFWSLPGWRALHAQRACYPMLDDHELVDNFGSAVEHRRPEWRRVARGALEAYVDYQGSRVRPRGEATPDSDFDLDSDSGSASQDFSGSWGDVGYYALDLRTNRRVGGPGEARIYSDDQADALDRFLRENEALGVVLLILSVPPVHLPRWVARTLAWLTPSGEDFSDRWSSAGHRADRDRLLRRLHEQQRRCPAQRVVVLSGDIHIACVHEIRWSDGTRPLHQLVASGLTNRASLATRVGSSAVIRANRKLVLDGGLEAKVRALRGVRGHARNPYGDLNVGIVEVSREPIDERGGRVRFLLYGHDGDEPVCVYRSPWI